MRPAHAAVVLLVTGTVLAGSACGPQERSAASSPVAAGSATVPAAAPATPQPASPTTTAAAPAPATPTPAAIPELPGGGTEVFDGKTYVALYGFPGSRALGVLGEQGTAATVTRAKRTAAKYRPYTERTVVPALEIIATVASASAGKDEDYSREAPIAQLRPLVDAAGKAGVYVVLDLQPGRSTFLSQARRYQELLLEPHVGLALDPEWRLKKKQKHLRQVGSVAASEIDDVSAWLATLTRVAGLPQKMLLLHQFKTSMIRDRSRLDTDHPELAFAIQMDGQGPQAAKRDTWRAIRRDAPDHVVFGWKNFYDEDPHMLSPRSTMHVKPQPRWVSYQ